MINNAEYHRKYRFNNKEKIRIIKHRYYLNHIVELKSKDKINGKTENHKFYTLRTAARRKGRVWELTRDEFKDIRVKPCYYCGYHNSTVGIDRVDNNVGYTLDNCVPCCFVCNRMKSILTYDEFIDKCKKIVKTYENCTR